MVSELLVLALDFFRSPLRYRQLTEPRHPLPKAFDTLLPELTAAIAPQNMETTARRLRRPPEEIERAALFFIRQVLFVPGADHYRVLGLSPEAAESSVRQHYQLLVRLFHPDRSAGEHELDATYTVRLNDAYSTLRDPETRQRYDEQLASLGRPTDSLAESLAFKPSDPFGMTQPDRDSARLLSGFGALLRPGPPIAAVISLGALAIWWLVAAGPFDQGQPRESGEPIVNLPQRKTDPLETSSLPAHLTANRQAAPSDQSARTNGTTTELTPVTSANAQAGNTHGPVQPKDPQARSTMLARSVTVERPVAPTAHNHAEEQPAPAQAPPANTRAAQPPTIANTALAMQPPDTSVSARQRPDPPAPAIARQETSPPPSDTRPAPTRATPSGLPAPEPAARTMQDSTGARATPSGKRIASETSPVERSRDESRSPPDHLGQTEKARASAQSTIHNRSSGPDRTGDGSVARDPPQRLTAVKAPRPATIEQHDAPPAPAKTRLHKADGDRVVQGFAAAYRSGDLAALTALFTDDAQVNDGRGTTFIRRDYANFFAHAPERTLDIDSLSWRVGPRGEFTGRARLEVRTRARGKQDWRSQSGTIEFELVTTPDGPRIARMIHRLAQVPDKAPLAARTQNTGKGSADSAPRPAVEPRRTAPTSQQANATLQRLTRAYERGDLDALVELFAANARVNGGQGTAFIRQDYQTFFAQTPERKLQIRPPDWRPTDDGRLLGTAHASIVVKPRHTSDQQRLEGTLSFELVETPAGIKIARLFDALK